jgi:hypothetical protein
MSFPVTLRKAFSLEPLVGDLRSASVGAIFGLLASFLGSILFAGNVREYSVLLNDAGYGQPIGLFDYAEQQDKKFRLIFSPPNFKDVYVCEFKLVTAENWRRIALSYLDTYRDCFDVSARSQNEYVVSPNYRSNILKKNGDAYECKCNH